MARKKKGAPVVTEPLEDVGVLAERLGLPQWQRRGLNIHKGWATGKQVTESAFRAALTAWLAGPM